ncbi:uncharacterized protein LOC130372962 isoform X3 [Gadus chalcogrammus]|uniref:uncharacterized protein LOC130372962 isoform X3 n=1 Tax=Gadus chalcogrammus TaxID=1042646 RepID=UPI0024C4C0BA|nr:uncharacterized protein LOC130372962 isoform X3 [Gadus chalcogrammus]
MTEKGPAAGLGVSVMTQKRPSGVPVMTQKRPSGVPVAFHRSIKKSTLAHALSNGPWKGLYLADEDAPHQYQSNSCGVFMLMGDALYQEVVVGQLLETFMLESPAELAGSFSPSPSPHLSYTFQSLSSESFPASPLSVAKGTIAVETCVRQLWSWRGDEKGPAAGLGVPVMTQKRPSGVPVMTQKRPSGVPVAFHRSLKKSTLAHALSNGPWKGLYLADEDVPHQYQSNSCGVFMLMGDMLSIRRWWFDSCWRPLCLKGLYTVSMLLFTYFWCSRRS